MMKSQTTPRQRLEALRTLRGYDNRITVASKTALSLPTVRRLETTAGAVSAWSLKAYAELIGLAPGVVEEIRQGKLKVKLDLVRV